MIRHYEKIGLVPAPPRRESGYRDYSDADVSRLAFIANARDLGFSIERIRVLLKLWTDRHRSNAEVKALALSHVAELEEKARQLSDMSTLLRRLAQACDGDGRPDCPILEGLEGAPGPRAGRTRKGPPADHRDDAAPSEG